MKVVDSREHGCEIWRTRLCTECGRRIYTKEVCRTELENAEKYKKVVDSLKTLKKLLEGIE